MSVLRTAALCLLVASTSAAPSAHAAEQRALVHNSPPRLRACCLLGEDQEIRFGPIRVPFIMNGVTDPQALGRHTYDGIPTSAEHNGIIFTCAGGFLDISHVRDYADWTAYLWPRIWEKLRAGGPVDICAYGQTRRLHIEPMPTAPDPSETALLLARRIAFQLAVWHETLTWFGYSTSSLWAERVSAFAPEDLYSDALGTSLGARAIRRAQREGIPYDEAATVELSALLSELGATSGDTTRAVLEGVEGSWWDRTVPVPRFPIIRRRSVAYAPPLSPWIPPHAPLEECSRTVYEPAAVELPERDTEGRPLADYYRLELGPPDAVMRAWCPVVADESTLTPAHFPQLVACARRGIREELGPAADMLDDAALPPGSTTPRQTRSPGAAEAKPALPLALQRCAVGDNPPSVALGPPAAVGEVGWGACGPEDPDCRHRLRDYHQTVRLLQLEAGGGIAGPGDLSGMGAFSVDGFAGETLGGDLELMSLDLGVDPGRRGMTFGFTFARAGALYFCDDATSERTYPPVMGWLHSCRGYWPVGIGGTLAKLVIDMETGRIAARPAELRVAVDLWPHGDPQERTGRQLVLWAGSALDVVRAVDVPGASTDTTVAPRLRAGLTAGLSTPGHRMELRLTGAATQGLRDSEDRGVEALSELRLHLLLGGGPVPAGGRGEDRRLYAQIRPWALLSLILHGGYARWETPALSISDAFAPFVSDRDEESWHVMLSARFSLQKLMF